MCEVTTTREGNFMFVNISFFPWIECVTSHLLMEQDKMSCAGT